MTAALLKKKLRDHLANNISGQELEQWFDPLLFSFNAGQRELHISFPHAFFGRWFMESIQERFAHEAAPVLSPFTVQYAGHSEKTVPAPLKQQAHGQEEKAGAKTAELSLSVTAAEETETQQKKALILGRIPLQDHTFASFLVNKKNDFPMAAAKEAVSTIFYPQYFPFVLFGHSGSGKTHLMEAMIHAIAESTPAVRIFYGDAEDFLVFAKQHSHQPNFGNMQAFFIDDAQRLFDAGSNVQKQAAGYLDTLSRDHRAVFLCLDTSPTQRAGILPQLRQRLTSGLVVKLKKPDVHIRRLYVQHMNTEFSLGLTKGQTLSLAQNVTDFRSIIGTLTRIKAYKLLVGDEAPDIEHIIHTLGAQNTLTPQGIVRCVAEYCGTTEQEVTGSARNQNACTARHYAMYLCRELLGFSLVQVGRFFGGRDHSSVVYSIKKIKSLLASNSVTNNEVTTLKQMCLKRAGEVQDDG